MTGTAGALGLGCMGMRKIRVMLFGPTTVVLPDDRTVSDLGGSRPRQLLAILAANVGTPVSKARLAEALWDDHPPRTGTDTLESYIALLRRHIGVACGPDSPLATRPNGYLLDGEQVEVDLDSFRRLVGATSGVTTPPAALDRIEAALRLASGPLLASEPYADWAVEQRGRFQSEYLRVCNRAAAQALNESQPQVAVDMARRAIGCDAIAETSWQLLIRGLAATGARSEALCAYLQLRSTLVDALGTEPNATSQELYADLLAEDNLESAVSATRVREVRSLLSLLRNALETCPSFDLSQHDRRLTEQAQRLVATA
jgi:SARP family transcriptional regulator, regulator of embCAB operon